MHLVHILCIKYFFTQFSLIKESYKNLKTTKLILKSFFVKHHQKSSKLEDLTDFLKKINKQKISFLSFRKPNLVTKKVSYSKNLPEDHLNSFIISSSIILKMI